MRLKNEDNIFFREMKTMTKLSHFWTDFDKIFRQITIYVKKTEHRTIVRRESKLLNDI